MSARADSRLPQASPAATLAPADKLDRIFDILAERALQETGATSVAIGLLRDGGVTCRATAGVPMTEIGDPINRETGLTGLAIRRQMSQWCSDTESDARVDQEVCRQLGVRSIIVVPVSAAGRCGWRVCHLFGKSRCLFFSRSQCRKEVVALGQRGRRTYNRRDFTRHHLARQGGPRTFRRANPNHFQSGVHAGKQPPNLRGQDLARSWLGYCPGDNVGAPVKRKCFLAACIILAVTAIASADTLYLKNGMYIVVTKATEKDGQIEYWVGSTKYTISKTLVTRIGPDNGPSTNLHSANQASACHTGPQPSGLCPDHNEHRARQITDARSGRTKTKRTLLDSFA